jgi:hypothetical protein
MSEESSTATRIPNVLISTYDLPARRASAIITISHFSKARIVAALGVDPDKVHVAYLGHR